MVKKKKYSTYNVQYDKRVGGIGNVLVRANDSEQAIINAKQHVFTGGNFRNPIKVDDSQYTKPREQGFQGSERV